MTQTRKEVTAGKDGEFRWLRVLGESGMDTLFIRALEDNPIWKSPDVAAALFSAIMNLSDLR